MDTEKIKVQLGLVKRCIKNKIPIRFKPGTYIPAALVLRYVKGEWLYTVECHDINRVDSSITVGLDDIDWPVPGGGDAVCKE